MNSPQEKGRTEQPPYDSLQESAPSRRPRVPGYLREAGSGVNIVSLSILDQVRVNLHEVWRVAHAIVGRVAVQCKFGGWDEPV